MVYSSHKNFIFVHIYKTGGTSIAEALIPQSFSQFTILKNRILCRPKYHRKLLQPCFKHATAQEIRQELGYSAYDKAFTFAFVRNPWDLQVSLYKYLSRWERGPNYQEIKAMDDFDEFIYWRIGNGIRNQTEFLCDESGRLIVDFVGRFENLEKDFRWVANKIGIKASLGKLNASNRKHYSNYYSKETASLVKQAYINDIQLFNYAFEKEPLD